MPALDYEDGVGSGFRGGLCISAMAGLALLYAHTDAYAADKEQVDVSAYYGISFSGINIGHFQFNSQVDGNRYVLKSDSRVKLLFGAFKFNSQSQTAGTIGKKAAPQSFTLNYQIKKKRKRADMQFARGNIVKLTTMPRVNYSNKYVPIKPDHLINVVDPMTAIMEMTRRVKGNPCQKSVEIFDGRRRMRLVLSPKGRRKIKERKPSGQPKFGYVCRIKFTPIAGHKKSRQIRDLARNKGLEIVLRPVPSANLVVPYQISIPTMFGTVTVDARAINIINAGHQRIAMKH